MRRYGTLENTTDERNGTATSHRAHSHITTQQYKEQKNEVGKQVASKLPYTTCTTRKWPHLHVPAHLRLPVSPMEMRANSLMDVVVLSLWTSLMKMFVRA